MTTMEASAEERLRTIGAKRKRLKAQLDEIEPHVKAAIVAGHEAGLPQKDIAEMTGYTRDSVYAITNPEVAANRKAKRRKAAD